MNFVTNKARPTQLFREKNQNNLSAFLGGDTGCSFENSRQLGVWHDQKQELKVNHADETEELVTIGNNG